jgi:DASS family divalent anion:Na+ symporter
MDTVKQKMPAKKIVGLILGLVFCLVIALLPPPEGLTGKSMIAFGLFAMAIFFWVFNVFSFFITSMILVISFPLLGVSSFAHAFSGYTASTWWFMLGAMGISTALGKTGLMKRFTYTIMRFFAPTFKGQLFGLTVSSLVITPFIPSVTAKTAMVMPIAKGISDSMGYKAKTRELHGLYLAAFASITLISYSFVSSNFFCYFAMGLLPEADQANFGWLQWLVSSLPWLIIVIVSMMVFNLVLYRPKTETSLMTKEYVQKELTAMGKMTGKEIFTIVLLLVAVAFWATENLHHISGNLVALGALVILLIANIITINDFKAGVPWDMLLMIGALMGLGAVFNSVGINEYITTLVTPVVNSISGNPYLFVALIAGVLYALRFVYADTMTILVIMVPLLTPLANVAGISPWIGAFTVLTSCATWNVIFQNTFMMQGYAAYGGDETVSFGSLSKLSYVFMVVNLIALWISIPLWQIAGLIK